jgi:hypothetical protein
VNFVEASKTVAVLDENLTTSQTHSPVIDTIGFSHASIDVVFEKVAAAGTASAVATSLKLQQGDGTTYADIVNFTGSTATTLPATANFTIPHPVNTTTDNVVRFDVDLKGQQGRYLRVLATGNATGSIYTVARLSKGEQLPWNAATKGALASVSGQLGVNLAPNVTYVG